MPKLVNNEIMGVSTGQWSVTANMTSGTATLQMSVRDGPFFDISGTSFSQTDGGRIIVPDCKIKAILTGDATWEVDKILNA